MKNLKQWMSLFAFSTLIGLIVFGANSFTDVNATKYWGKTSLKDLTETLDANFALLESGGTMAGMTFTGGAFNGTVGATTPAAGKFTTINASSTLVVTGAITAVGGVTGAHDGTVGATTPAAGKFTTINASSTCVVTGALTCASVDTGTGEATVDGKYAVVGPNATTGFMIDKGGGASVTNAATVTFTATFGATPIVILGYAADPGGTNQPYSSSVTTSNFVVNAAAGIACNWIAVGTRP